MNSSPVGCDDGLPRRKATYVTTSLKGVLLCLLLGIIVMVVAQFFGWSNMTMAIILGLVFHGLYGRFAFKLGIDFSATKLLYLGVALLGLKIDFGVILGAGMFAPALSLTSLALTMVVGIMMCSLLKIERRFGVLLSGAVAICGVSAAAAICCAIPKCEAREKYLTLTIISVTVLSTIAMLTYPIISQSFSLTDYQSGVFFGATIHNVSQVVGAGYSVSEQSGDVATFVKLVRVSALLPVILLISLAFRAAKGASGNRWDVYFPPFLIAFFIFAVIGNLNFVPTKGVNLAAQTSEFLLVTSLVAIGLRTKLGEITQVGIKPLVAVTLTTLFMAGFVIVALIMSEATF